MISCGYLKAFLETSFWASEQGAKVLVDHLQDGIYVITGDRIDYANRQLAQLLGYPLECLIGRKFLDFIAVKDRPLVLERHNARLSGESVPQLYDIHLLTADGREVCCALNNYLMQLDDGEIVIIGSARDISRQVTERTELEKSQLELQNIFDKLPDVFYRTDMQGMITMMSPSCFDILGYRQESMIGTPMASYYETPDDRLRVVQAIVDGNGRATKVEAALKHRNGNRIWISTNAVIRLGGDGKPYCIEGVARDITERKGMEDMLTALSQVDPLTGIYNRRYFMDKTEELFSLLRRHNRPASFLVMDLDYFKNINDQYGHQVGDSALMDFTQVCREVIREQDVFGRLGGEEFGMMLPETRMQQALSVAERIRVATYERNFSVNGNRIPLSVSIGLVEISHEDDMLGSVVRRADMAMYQAKEAGRNQVKTA